MPLFCDNMKMGMQWYSHFPLKMSVRCLFRRFATCVCNLSVEVYDGHIIIRHGLVDCGLCDCFPVTPRLLYCREKTLTWFQESVTGQFFKNVNTTAHLCEILLYMGKTAKETSLDKSGIHWLGLKLNDSVLNDTHFLKLVKYHGQMTVILTTNLCD